MDDEDHDPHETLPVALEPPVPHPGFQRTTPGSAFLSHLLAEKHNLNLQRAKRRGTVGQAVDAYDASTNATAVRMPKGYRKTVVV